MEGGGRCAQTSFPTVRWRVTTRRIVQAPRRNIRAGCPRRTGVVMEGMGGGEGAGEERDNEEEDNEEVSEDLERVGESMVTISKGYED